MQRSIRTLLLAGFCLLPATAFAQFFVDESDELSEDALIIEEPSIVEDPMMGSNLLEEDAVAIAMLNGLVSVEDVDENWNGDYKVDGTDASGDDVEITIDGETGAVIGVDD